MELEIVQIPALSGRQRDNAAEVLKRAFAHAPSAWPDIDAARAEVATFFDDPDRFGLAALVDDGLVGWIGAIRHSPHAWELHPLAVDPQRQRHGCGRRLVAALEGEARRAGILTIWLGTDDDFGGTSIFGVDLYPDVLDHLTKLKVTAGHPLAFYRRLGYAIVGVLPDVDGPGRHDILMARRIGGAP